MTIHAAIRKHGWSNFTACVLETHDDEDYANDVLEPKYITEYDSYQNGYNETTGGGANFRVSEATKQRMSESSKGQKQDPEWIEKRISQIRGEKNGMHGKTVWKGRHHTDETKRKMSEAKQGYKPWNTGKGGTYGLSDSTKRR